MWAKGKAKKISGMDEIDLSAVKRIGVPKKALGKKGKKGGERSFNAPKIRCDGGSESGNRAKGVTPANWGKRKGQNWFQRPGRTGSEYRYRNSLNENGGGERGFGLRTTTRLELLKRRGQEKKGKQTWVLFEPGVLDSRRWRRKGEDQEKSDRSKRG